MGRVKSQKNEDSWLGVIWVIAYLHWIGHYYSQNCKANKLNGKVTLQHLQAG